MKQTYILAVYRGHPNHQYWEEFELELSTMANVISSLMEIQKRPINRLGEKVAPIVWLFRRGLWILLHVSKWQASASLYSAYRANYPANWL